jgi:hypothetical protein
MTNTTDRQMKKELVRRLGDMMQNVRSTMNALDALDRIEDYDLVDQMTTADNLMAQMDDLLERMNNVVGN